MNSPRFTLVLCMPCAEKNCYHVADCVYRFKVQSKCKCGKFHGEYLAYTCGTKHGRQMVAYLTSPSCIWTSNTPSIMSKPVALMFCTSGSEHQSLQFSSSLSCLIKLQGVSFQSFWTLLKIFQWFPQPFWLMVSLYLKIDHRHLFPQPLMLYNLTQMLNCRQIN